MRRNSVWVSWMAVLLTSVPGSAQEVVRNVAYTASPHPEQHLDFGWPGRAPAATVLFIHGGGLSESGERRDSAVYARVCDRFIAAGLGCASMDYRLSPAFQWPAMAEDVAAGVVKVRELVAASGGDPDRLFLFGHSSGCQLAAVVSTHAVHLAGAGLDPADLAGVVLMGCVLDVHDAQLRGLTPDDIADRFAQSSSDVARYGTPENWIAANPSFGVGPHVPPTLVVVARQERFFPSILEQGARYVRRLLEADVPADVAIVPGRHMSSIAKVSEADDPTFAAILRFIREPRALPW